MLDFSLRLCTGRAMMGLALLIMPVAAQAHFQELIPSSDILPESGGGTVGLDLLFTHPFEGGPVMDMGVPVQFGVLAAGHKTDLRPTLIKRDVAGKTAYQASYRAKEPGDYVFYLEPAPYWEPAERKFIVHYTKVVVDYASGRGWDGLVGLPVEIEPLTRPYGLWTGNQFSGLVRKGGKPVPFAEIEVEWRNDGTIKAPADPFVTQVIKADAQGHFSYVMPRAGWWGFAALTEAAKPMKAPDGKMVPVEAGALIWVRAVDMK